MTDKAPSQLSEHPQSEVHASAFKPAEHPVTALALLRVPAWEPERLAAQLDLDWNIGLAGRAGNGVNAPGVPRPCSGRRRGDAR